MKTIFIDTEKTQDKPWSVQYGNSNKADIWLVDEKKAPPIYLTCPVEDEEVLTVVHNALFDIPVLRELGICVARFVDTMQMAYLLGLDKLGLKTLAYRFCKMRMREFWEVTEEATRRKAREYLEKVVGREWEDPDPVVEYDEKGDVKVKFPRNIRNKVLELLKKFDKNPTIDLHDKWSKMDWEGGRGQVEAVMGKMDRGWLCDVKREDAVEYALNDVKADAKLFPVLWERVVELGLEDTLWRDMGAMEMVMDMERNGCMLDLPFFKELSRGIHKEVDRLENELAEVAGRRVNVNSSKQVLWLMGKVGVAVESTGAEELDRFRHIPEVKLVQDIRGLLKLAGTYVDKFPYMVDKDNRIHTKLSMTRTETGRIASSNPNLMNIPVRSEWGKKIRKGFVAGEGNVLVAIDYSQIEMRKAADESGDEYMCQVFYEEKDIHTMTASSVYKKPPEEIDDKKERYPMKRAGFGVLYMITGAGLLDVFYHEGITVYSEKDCDRFIADWYGVFPGIRRWQEKEKGFALRNGYVVDMFGRRRWIPEVYSALPYVKEAGIRQAINYPIQSGAQQIIKEAMRQLQPLVWGWQDGGFTVKPLLQIHDELLFEVQEDIVEVVVPQFVDVMVNAVELSVPVKVDAEVGKNWLDMVGFEEWLENN